MTRGPERLDDDSMDFERFDSRTALIIVDVQQAIETPRLSGRNNPELIPNLQRALERWRALGRPVYFVAHDSVHADSPFRPGQPGNDFHPALLPLEGEPVIRKSTSSALIGTNFEALLREAGLRKLVIGGIETNNCIEGTVRSAGDLGFEVYVLADGTATCPRTDRRGRRWEAEDMHQISLANMAAEYATVIETADLLRAAPLSQASPIAG